MEGYTKIKIENSNSLYDIFKKIKNTSSKEGAFYLEVDENEALKNYLNLKILLSKLSGKKLAIVTSNKELKKIWERLWIKYFFKSEEIEFDEKFSKTNVLRYNYTFFEYLKYEFKKFFFKYVFLFKKKAKKTYKNKRNWPESHVFLLIAWLILSFSLFSFIFYFAVSKTYVYIKPELGVKTVSRNLVYSEKDNSNIFDNRNVIKTIPVITEASLDFPFHVSTIDLKSSKNAYGKVEIFNELNVEQVFRANTRFVTEDWLIFRSEDWIKIPPSTKTDEGKLIIWKTEIILVADVYDNKSKIIWIRWNINSWTILTIPWLKFNRDKVYAKTKEEFKWWLDPKVHILTQEEFDKFTWIFAEKFKSKALNLLKEKIKQMNTTWWTDFQIIPINNILKNNIGKIEILHWVKIWDKIDEITLRSSWSILTYVYDKNSTIFYLKSILNENILLWTEKLIWVNEDSLRISNILSQTTDPFYMKATTELDSTVSYNFEDSTNNLTRKLKNLLINTSSSEATSILLNDKHIANVKIEFSPFWLTRVSNNPDNIEFIIEK